MSETMPIRSKPLAMPFWSVTGHSAAKKSGALDDLIAVLDENEQSYALYDGIGQNPKLSDCMEAALVAESLGADAVIGIGGGSPRMRPSVSLYWLPIRDHTGGPVFLSLGACTASHRSHRYDRRYGQRSDKGSRDHQPAGIQKKVDDERLFPALSLGDPAYTNTLPELFTKSTAIDARRLHRKLFHPRRQ